jgi:flagellar motor switch protein FliN
MLELEAGNCKIAAGEAVKVGDKFGLRIASIVPPDERFVAIKPNQK